MPIAIRVPTLIREVRVLILTRVTKLIFLYLLHIIEVRISLPPIILSHGLNTSSH